MVAAGEIVEGERAEEMTAFAGLVVDAGKWWGAGVAWLMIIMGLESNGSMPDREAGGQWLLDAKFEI